MLSILHFPCWLGFSFSQLINQLFGNSINQSKSQFRNKQSLILNIFRPFHSSLFLCYRISKLLHNFNFKIVFTPVNFIFLYLKNQFHSLMYYISGDFMCLHYSDKKKPSDFVQHKRHVSKQEVPASVIAELFLEFRLFVSN